MEYIILTLIICFTLFMISRNIILLIKNCFLSINFTQYASILNYHMDKAYNMIHKDQILVYSLDGVRPREEDVENISKEFANLTIKFLGEKNYKDLVDFYGSEQSLLLNILEYFSTHFENDEIREASINKLSDNEENNNA